MNFDNLIEMLQQPEYKTESYPLHTHPTFEKLNDYGNIRTLFDDLLETLGRVPTQTEYVTAGVERAKLFFTPRKDFGNGNIKYQDIDKGRTHQFWDKSIRAMNSGTFYWNDPELQKAVKKRLSRTYPSFLVEYITIQQLKVLYPNYKIGSNDWLDSTAGIDIVVASPEHNRIVYVHVTSNSQQSKDTLNEKKTRKAVAIDEQGKKHWYVRDFNKGHINLAFSKFDDTVSTQIINGNPVFKDSHLKQVVDTTMMIPDPNGGRFDTWKMAGIETPNHQLLHLHKFLLDNKISANGLGKVWL